MRPAAAHVPEHLAPTPEGSDAEGRPENFSRSLFHVANAAAALLVIELAPRAMLPLASAFLGAAVLMEGGRKLSPTINAALMRVFAPVAHPHEHTHINSASWYTLALFALALTGQPPVCAVGVVVLGLADPAAALVGRRWGRHRLANGRSLEGTLAFVAVGTVAATAVLWALHPALRFAVGAAMAFSGATLGGLVELASDRIDDNFSIPLAAAAGALAVGWLV